jgi:hypothetical protein
MQNINFEHKKGYGFYITDFPNAEKIIALSGIKAQELADMALHRSDLIQAEEYLDLSIVAEDTSPNQRALWKMAIITFTKCFGKNNGRATSLDITQILPGDTLGQEVFAYFKNLRDKNIAHDDNPISQCIVGAVINKADAPYKVEKIITMNILGEVNGEENINNLRNLIKNARSYVEKKYNELCDDLAGELETLSQSELIKMEAPSYNKPTAEDVSENKKKLKN